MQMFENHNKSKHSRSANGFSFTLWLKHAHDAMLGLLLLPKKQPPTKAAGGLRHCRKILWCQEWRVWDTFLTWADFHSPCSACTAQHCNLVNGLYPGRCRFLGQEIYTVGFIFIQPFTFLSIFPCAGCFFIWAKPAFDSS